MIETIEYLIEDEANKEYNIKCRIEYDTNNAYNTSYYFYDGNKWLKDFIDLNKLSPKDEGEIKNFEDFITRVHDYMVHDDMWNELKEIKENETVTKDNYNLIIKANKIEG